MVVGHAAWFVHGHFPYDWGFAGETLSLVYITVAVALAVIVRIASKRWSAGRDIPFLARLVPWMPFVVRLHISVALIMLASFGRYLTPAMHLHQTVAGYLLGALELAVAVLFAAGWHTRIAALLLVASGPIGMLAFGFFPVLLGVHLLGGAMFVLFTGPGRWSADWELGNRIEFSFDQAARAIWCFRVSTGLALLFASFDEKLARPNISVVFLQLYPRFNVLADIGVPIGNLEFTRFAGGMEVLLALLLISGALPQIITPVAAFPFIATLTLLGTFELGGHLPDHAALIAFIVFASDPKLRATVYMLWPWRWPRPRISRQSTQPTM